MTLKILQKQNFQVCPHLVIAGSKNNLKHIFMVAEGNVFFEVLDAMDSPVALLGMFCCFDTKYPDRCNAFNTFLELLLSNRNSIVEDKSNST